MINFNQIIESRGKLLQERIALLEKIKGTLKIEGPINFSIDNIVEDDKYNPRKNGVKVGVPQLSFLEKSKGSYVYFFELSEVIDKNILLEKIKEFKSNEIIDGIDKKRAMSKSPSSFDDNISDILYVGSIKENIHKRIKEHIGFGSKSTYAIHLKHWAPKELKLNFYYIKIENPDLTYDIEAAIADYLNPLIGKREK
jgi:hypothetical protein